MWTAQPCSGWVVAMFVLKGAFQNQDLFAAPMLMRIEFCPWAPAHQSCAFRAMAMQRQDAEARHLAGQEIGASRVDDLLFGVGLVELMQFYKDRAAIL